MKIAFFNTHRFDRKTFDEANQTFGHDLTYYDTRLFSQTVRLAEGSDAVCSFVNDCVDAETIRLLKERGVRLIALRSAGYNHVDLVAATKVQIPVVRVPEYSPYAVAEHAVAMILSLNRKLHHAYVRVRELNFSLDGLVGFDLHGKKIGVIGMGRIGKVMATIMKGFGCEVLAYDSKPDEDFRLRHNVNYVDLQTLYRESDVISLHLPLTPKTRHIVDEKAFATMKPGVMIINTGRGALIDAKALIQALKQKRVGAAGLDVYEEEENVFFHDLSDNVLDDDVLAPLLTFPNVLVTSHQAFLTREALRNIAVTTLRNVSDFEAGIPLKNQIFPG